MPKKIVTEKKTVSRILSSFLRKEATIYLGAVSPLPSCGLPKCQVPFGTNGRTTRGLRRHSYLALHPAGFTEPSRSPAMLVSSYLTFSPLPAHRRRRYLFCGTFHRLFPKPYGTGRRRLRVTKRSVLRSSDFPHRLLHAARLPVFPSCTINFQITLL